MKLSVVVLGADDDFGAGLCREFTSRGWAVFGLTAAGEPESEPSLTRLGTAGAFDAPLTVDLESIASFESAAADVAAAAPHIDILVCNLRPSGSASDFDSMLRAHDRYGLATLRFLETFLPLATSGMKRLCFMTSPDAILGDRAPSHVAVGDRVTGASIHMAAAIAANDLGPDGYSVRLYIPGDGADGLSQAFDYLTGPVDPTPLAIDDHLRRQRAF